MAISFDKAKHRFLTIVHTGIAASLAAFAFYLAAEGKVGGYAFICVCGVLNGWRLGVHFCRWRDYW